MNKILLLGSDINVYYMARCYYELYHTKADVLGKEEMRFTKGSNIINISYNEKLRQKDAFLKILIDYYKEHYTNEKVLLVPCHDVYVRLVVENAEELKKYYTFNTPNEKIMDSFLVKEKFYETYKNSTLDFPQTYFYDVTKTLNIPENFKYPLILKPGDGLLYYRHHFENQAKVYRLNTKAELEDIRQVCDQYGLYLYLDGARLGYWLSASDCDVTLADLARLTDAFYIGGTKCGCLMGEALVIVNPELRHGFWTATKQSGGVLAKGWLLGLQFYTLFKDDLYFSITRQADELATQMETAFVNAGLSMYTKNTTNQKFVILSNEQAEYLGKSYIFEFDHKVDDEHICVRFCTSWSTEITEVQQLVKDICIMK